MAMNKVQFQKGLSLDGFLKKYGIEAQCEEALAAAPSCSALMGKCAAHLLMTRGAKWHNMRN
ncbi:MAG: hypothetical protein HHJ12_10210 [Glaciimonas sp.]|nr:hypothetical protein [Glaciimonas sp.]